MSGQHMSRRNMLRSMMAVGAGSVVAGAVAACSPEAPAAPSAGTAAPAAGAAGGEDIRVVGIFPVSGFIAADGKEMRNGVVMAVDEINELGGLLGRKLKYIEVDDVDSNAEQITTAFQRAVDVEKADVIFSGYHLASGPEFDIVAKSGTLYYNVNTQEAWTDRYKKDPNKYWSIFQNDPNDTWYGGGFAL
jgi:branched-chain amino acid transport system substrate-binding protein